MLSNRSIYESEQAGLLRLSLRKVVEPDVTLNIEEERFLGGQAIAWQKVLIVNRMRPEERRYDCDGVLVISMVGEWRSGRCNAILVLSVHNIIQFTCHNIRIDVRKEKKNTYKSTSNPCSHHYRRKKVVSEHKYVGFDGEEAFVSLRGLAEPFEHLRIGVRSELEADELREHASSLERFEQRLQVARLKANRRIHVDDRAEFFQRFLVISFVCI